MVLLLLFQEKQKTSNIFKDSISNRLGVGLFMRSITGHVELIDPALKGTVNVLRSCAKVPSIKRVVLTSSMAAVICNRKMLTPGLHMDETWFSDPLFCKESKSDADKLNRRLVRLKSANCTRERLRHDGFLGLFGHKVDLLDYHEKKLQDLEVNKPY
ncbi:CSC1-like protein HYP1 [Camellia lanceoleosa]|uniref:CSC1-like protein HYP1 n=1 Tax=Camellia lanceoleosa TaxID=1840588 RepID=A0ACC0FQW0_9ERIC|nr:CSC1-like protein HYP1 [Camellia lanceoleosa]